MRTLQFSYKSRLKIYTKRFFSLGLRLNELDLDLLLL